MNVVETLRQADFLILQERPDEASRILKDFLEHQDNPLVWWKLARTMQIFGEEVVARGLLRNIVLKLNDPHILDIIAARIPVAKPHIFEEFKLLYFGIPKCGSSTIKDAFLIAKGGDPKGELSHEHSRHFSRPVSFKQLDHDFKEYKKFTIIRHPRERLRSYWKKNISEAHSLADEAKNKEIFYGLPTNPSYSDIVAQFARYRAIFRDFRHHTDGLIGFVGSKPGRLDHIYDMSTINDALTLISERSGAPVPSLRNMKSSPEAFEIDVETERAETRLINHFYEHELRVFSFSQQLHFISETSEQ